MCMKITCSTCKKPTWSGCGQHIEAALRGVAESDRCAGWKNGKCMTAATKTAGTAK
jgi:hypothetical protein